MRTASQPSSTPAALKSPAVHVSLGKRALPRPLINELFSAIDVAGLRGRITIVLGLCVGV